MGQVTASFTITQFISGQLLFFFHTTENDSVNRFLLATAALPRVVSLINFAHFREILFPSRPRRFFEDSSHCSSH